MAAEYRIVVKVDPGGVKTGSAAVKQELRGIETTANQTQRAVDKATKPPKSTGTDQVAAGLNKVADASTKVEQGTTKVERGYFRVLKGSKDIAAETFRLNDLMSTAKKLFDAGTLSNERYARAQQVVAAGLENVRLATIAQHAETQKAVAAGKAGGGTAPIQTPQSINQVGVAAAAAVRPVQALNQEVAAGAAAASKMSVVAGVLGGVLGGAVALGAQVLMQTLGELVVKWIENARAVENHVKQLKESAKQADITRQANVIFSNTIEGVTEALRVNALALKGLEDQQKTAARQALEDALQAKERLVRIRDETQANIDLAKSMLQIQVQRATRGGERGEIAALGLTGRQQALDALEAQLKNTDAKIATAQDQIANATSRRIVELADRDQVQIIKDRYDGPRGLIELARRRAVAEKQSTTELARQVKLLAAKRDAEVQAQQDRERAANRAAPSDGVARFKSQAQAIGIAGREFQRAGLDVSGNTQFRVTGGHGNNAEHNRTAIDVNSSANPGRSTGGINEASVPALKAQFDAAALRYQARGYQVLWNGQVYPAFGNGPSGPIKGADKHTDHMHLSAPATIVGKPTQASSEAQAITGERREATVEEQQADFVQSVVDQAAGRGVSGATNNTKAQIDRVLADYKRKFNTAMSPGDQAAVTGALTDAEARETAARFEEAYNRPLERLQALQGKTGLSRQILNAQLEESTRLGRALTPVESARIDASIREQEALQREADLLASIRQPLQDYQDQIATLTVALNSGAISQTEFNSRVNQLQDGVSQFKAGLPGQDAFGSNFAEQGQKDEAARQKTEDLRQLEEGIRRGTIMSYERTAIEQAIEKKHNNALRAITDARRQIMVGSAQSIATDLANIAEMSVGKQNGIYKALFIASKAFAIAESVIAIQTGIAKAASEKFPYNLAAIASVIAATASIVSNIQAVSLNLKDGGYISGRGGARDDAIPVNASNGEFMVNAEATAKNRPLLEAINNGAMIARGRAASNDNAGTVRAAGGDSYQLTFGDVIVKTASGTTASDGESIGRDVKAAIGRVVDERIADAKRAGGALTRTRASVMTG